MESLYPHTLFETPGMIWVFGAVIFLEILSLIYTTIAVMEFRMRLRKHCAFFQAIGSGEETHEEHTSSIIFWTYVIFTAILTVVTIVLFTFQPHIL